MAEVTCVQHLNKLSTVEMTFVSLIVFLKFHFIKRFINRIPPAPTLGVHLIASIELGDCKTEVDSGLF